MKRQNRTDNHFSACSARADLFSGEKPRWALPSCRPEICSLALPRDYRPRVSHSLVAVSWRQEWKPSPPVIGVAPQPILH
jgi:hypothetical protein